MFGAYVTMSKPLRLLRAKREAPLGFIVEGQVGGRSSLLATLKPRMGYHFLADGLVLDVG